MLPVLRLICLSPLAVIRVHIKQKKGMDIHTHKHTYQTAHLSRNNFIGPPQNNLSVLSKKLGFATFVTSCLQFKKEIYVRNVNFYLMKTIVCLFRAEYCEPPALRGRRVEGAHQEGLLRLLEEGGPGRLRHPQGHEGIQTRTLALLLCAENAAIYYICLFHIISDPLQELAHRNQALTYFVSPT